ncbi:MAG: ABC transporter substrate-binding protein [Lachnospiraceae bacterium]|nr:ABC transporter substrate-binding protein [Lachnospiraceae bacterium]
MRKHTNAKRVSAVLLTLAMAFSAMAGSVCTASADESEEITDLVMWQLASNEVTTFQYLYSGSQANSVLASGYDCWLVSNPVTTAVEYRLADSYETTDDGTTWVFHLREGVTWVDNQGNYKADVVVEDFLTSAEYLLNFWKNDGNNTSDLCSTLVGANDYYEYTKSLDQEEALALTYRDEFSEMVTGVAADDEANTVTYTCLQPTAYFWSLATRLWLAPLAEGAVEEVGVENYNSVNYDERWYCGPYLMSSYTSGNEKVLIKNPAYWNEDLERFDTITIKMIESYEIGYQLYINGEIDQIDLTEATLTGIISDSTNQYYDYVVQKYEKAAVTVMLFNFNKNNEDGTEDTNWNTAVANENFRLSISWGLDLTNLLSNINPIDPVSVAGYNFSHDLMCSTSDGTDYQNLVLEKLGIDTSSDELQRYDTELAQQYKEAAIEELTAEGVTFPIELDYYVAADDQSALDTANIIKSIFDECLGTDYINFTIKSYVSSASSEVLTPSLHSIYLSKWKADYADPQNTMGQFILGDDGAAYATSYQKSNEVTDEELLELLTTFTDMVNEAATIYTDMDARYDAYAEAEAYYIEHALMVPLYKNISFQLTKINDYSKSDTQYGGWETNVNGYTAEDYAEFAAALGK